MASNMLGNSALVEVAGPFRDFWEKLGGPEGERWLEAFKRFLRKEDAWPKFPTYRVQVNYDLSVEAAIRAGRYDWENDDITAGNFPSTRQGVMDLDIILVHYNRNMQDEDIDKDLGRQGLRDAELPELLAFAAKYPDLQREFPIVARGSVWLGAGPRRVPYLWWDSGLRSLRLSLFDDGWHSHCRFAAVPQVTLGLGSS